MKINYAYFMKSLWLRIFLSLLIFIVFGFLGYFTMNKLVKKTPDSTIKIAFFGDSITQFGWEHNGGYVRQVLKTLSDKGLNVEPIPAGICGHTTRDMSARVYNDIIQKKPDIVFFMGGINDIWGNRIEFTESKQNLENIIRQIKGNGIRPIIISLTIIGEDINSPKNKEVDSFNEYLKVLAKQNNVQYIDANTAFKNELKKHNNPNGVLTVDGVHLNDKGNKILADTITEEFLKKYKH